MRADHTAAFSKVAREKGCWIGLREPNPLADRWVGRPGGTPKPKECKAKTADNPTSRLAGLVVDPILCPEAFTPPNLVDAQNAWKKFAPGANLPARFTRVEDGPERGLVKFDHLFIYADYDLMAVAKAGPGGEKIPAPRMRALEKDVVIGARKERAFAEEVQDALNEELKIKMVQHGPEMMWGGVGGRTLERVWWFGPSGGPPEISISSMPKLHGRVGGH